MPMGTIPASRIRARSPYNPGLRLRAWWNRIELDEELAAGVQPAAGTPLRYRAEQLVSRAERGRLAKALDATLRQAYKARPGGAGLQLRHGEIRACADDIAALALRLDEWRPIDVRGAAMVSLLLSDPSGPLSRDSAISLRHAVRSARLALDPTDVGAALLDAA
jgi:hypothetical protein